MYKNKRLLLKAARMLLCLVISASRYRYVTGIGFQYAAKVAIFCYTTKKLAVTIRLPLRVFYVGLPVWPTMTD